VRSTPNLNGLKRCAKCGEAMPRAVFSRDRSRKDGRYPQWRSCVREWHQANAEHLADYHRRWQQANRDKQGPEPRYRERKRDDPGYRERRRANARPRRDRAFDFQSAGER
jgi:hypothetical protein